MKQFLLRTALLGALIAAGVSTQPYTTGATQSSKSP